MAKTSGTPTTLAPWSLGDLPDPSLEQRRTRFWQALKNAAWELWRNRLATLGAAMVLLLFLVAFLAPFIARYDPVKQNYREMLQGPSAAHYFGTDKFGRDIWSRVVWGAQRSVIISLLAVMVGLMGGVPLGTISGYYGGKLDAVLMRVVDAWLAFPGILFYLIAATIIQAYKLSLFWNTVGLIIALGVEMLVLAALSFLGLGAPPPTPDWGADLNLAREHMETLPYLAIFPGLAISFAVLGFNLFGDGLRDILDPRLADR